MKKKFFNKNKKLTFLGKQKHANNKKKRKIYFSKLNIYIYNKNNNNKIWQKNS